MLNSFYQSTVGVPHMHNKSELDTVTEMFGPCELQ